MEVFFPLFLCLFKSLHLAFSLCPTCWHKHHINRFCFPVFQRLVAQTLPGSPALTLLTCLGVLQDRNWKTSSLCSVRQTLHVTTNTRYPVPPFNSLWPKYSDEEWQELFPHHRQSRTRALWGTESLGILHRCCLCLSLRGLSSLLKAGRPSHNGLPLNQELARIKAVCASALR